jgi:hypothetical protein
MVEEKRTYAGGSNIEGRDNYAHLCTGKIPGTGVRESDRPCNDIYLFTYRMEAPTERSVAFADVLRYPVTKMIVLLGLSRRDSIDFLKAS